MWVDTTAYLNEPVASVMTISVIDAPKESYDEYHERMVKEKGRKRFPFGFSIREEET